MKLVHFLLLGAAFWLPVLPNASATPKTTFDSPETAYSCSLPAPNNVQSNQTTSTVVDFTWNAVPSAWGYRGVLTNTSNGSATTQIVTNNGASFTVTPGQNYVFHVVAACSANSFSDAVTEVNFKAEYIVIELIVELNCPTDGRAIKDNDPSTLETFDFDWEPNKQYIIEFSKNVETGGEELAWLGFKLNDLGHFEIRELTQNPLPAHLCGLPLNNPSGCEPAPTSGGIALQVSNATFTCYGRKAILSLTSPTQLLFHPISAPDQPFNSFRIIEADCGNGANAPGGGLGSPDFPNLDVSALTQTANLNAKIANPFGDRLNIRFDGFPGEKIQFRLFDLQGKTHLNSNIDFEKNSGEQTLSFNTDNLLPGLYFISLDNGKGHFTVQKVVKI